MIARLHDARQAHLYRSLGVHPVSTISWGVDRICELLSFRPLEALQTMGDSEVELVRVGAHTLLVGTPVSALTVAGEIQVVSIERGSRAFIPDLGDDGARSRHPLLRGDVGVEATAQVHARPGVREAV